MLIYFTIKTQKHAITQSCILKKFTIVLQYHHKFVTHLQHNCKNKIFIFIQSFFLSDSLVSLSLFTHPLFSLFALRLPFLCLLAWGLTVMGDKFLDRRGCWRDRWWFFCGSCGGFFQNGCWWFSAWVSLGGSCSGCFFVGIFFFFFGETFVVVVGSGFGGFFNGFWWLAWRGGGYCDYGGGCWLMCGRFAWWWLVFFSLVL